MRSASLFLLVALVTSGCAEDFLATADARKGKPQPTLPGPERNPIVFVHGWNSSGAVWATMRDRFLADGWSDGELVAWSYNSYQSNVTTAEQLSDRIDAVLAQTGATHVDIVTHSMGGLSSRYYTKNLGGDTRVDGWISLGGPNHGTATADGCFTKSCEEMRAGSRFLRSLNKRDETPGTPRYATWWSACDVVILPQNSTPLSGATNRQTACLSHSALTSDATVYEQVKDWVTSNESGTPLASR